MNKEILEWIKFSKTDLEASKVLYMNKMYRNSYYFFQQSSEKANKALGIILGSLKEKDVKDVSHNQFKVIRKSVSKGSELLKRTMAEMESSNFPSEIIGSKEFIDIHIERGTNHLSYIDKLINEQSILEIEESTINGILDTLNERDKITISLPKNIKSEVRNRMMKIIEHYKLPNESIEELNRTLEDDSFEIIIKEFYRQFDVYKAFSFIYLTLFYCAILTEKHDSASRYPIKNFNVDNIYNEENPIIKNQLKFLNFLSEALDLMEINFIQKD